MARLPHVIAWRRWALEHPPARLRRIALQRTEVFLSSLGRTISPHVLSAWKVVLLGVEARLDRENLNAWWQSLPKDANSLEDLVFLFSVADRFPEKASRPVLCDRSPFGVPIDHVHLFDLSRDEIRRSLAQAVQEIESEGVVAGAKELFLHRSPLDYERLAKIRPVLDSLVAFAIRFSEGLGINNETVRFWIALNAHRARRAVDPRERRDSMRSLEGIVEALLPSEWVKEGPNEAGLALEYIQLKDSATPILKKRYVNPAARLLDLREKLPTLPRDVISRFAGGRPKEFALNVLAELHGGLSPAYLRNLINRGSLFLKICAYWSRALAEVPLAGLHLSLPIKG